jgi:hypothetical protein
VESQDGISRVEASHTSIPPRLPRNRLFSSLAVVLAAAAAFACAQPSKPNLPELIASNPDLHLLAFVLERNGLIPALSG